MTTETETNQIETPLSPQDAEAQAMVDEVVNQIDHIDMSDPKAAMEYIDDVLWIKLGAAPSTTIDVNKILNTFAANGYDANYKDENPQADDRTGHRTIAVGLRMITGESKMNYFAFNGQKEHFRPGWYDMST